MGNPLPVVTLFRGDAFYFVALIEDTDTVGEVAEKCAQHALDRRVPRTGRDLRVEYEGQVIELAQTAAQAGIAPMGTVYVSYP